MEPNASVSRNRLESRTLGSDLRSIPRDEGDDLEAKVLLGALRGTRLSSGPTWDAEADTRLRAFQQSVGLRATGRPDADTLGALAGAVEAQRIASLPSDAEIGHAEKALHAVFHGLAKGAEALGHDAKLRAGYVNEVAEMSAKLLERFATGQISLSEATHLAVNQRNLIMNATRDAQGQVGVAISKLVKEEGVTVMQAVERYAQRMFSKPAAKLTPFELAKVELRIVERSGVTNVKVNTIAAPFPHVGRVMHAAAIAFAFQAVMNAENKEKELATQVGGLVGGAVGWEAGAFIGGMVCGPPCAIVGALAGSIAGSYAGEEPGRHAYHGLRG